MSLPARRPVVALLFGVLLWASVAVREVPGMSLKMAVLWLPSGIGVAGLWLLGIEWAWVVAVVAVLQRLGLDNYTPLMIATSAVASAAEAVLGALLLRRLGFDGRFEQLRDLLALFATALVAPLASIVISMYGWALGRGIAEVGFHSGWFGWWRMNAIGILAVVPLVVTWARARPGDGARTAAATAALTAGVMGLTWLVMTQGPTHTLGILLLYFVVPLQILGTIRLGSRGGAAAAAGAVLTVALLAARDIGPFADTDPAARYTVVQVLILTLLGLPLLLGVLIAERERLAALRRESEHTLEAFQRLIPDITGRFAADGTCTDLHLPAGATATWLPPTAVGRRLDEVTPPLAPALGARIGDALAGADPAPLEFEDVQDGHRRVWETRLVRLNPAEVLSLTRDITQRHDAEALVAWQAEVLEGIATGRPLAEVVERLGRGVARFVEGGHPVALQLEGRTLHVLWAPDLPEVDRQALEGLAVAAGSGSCAAAVREGRTVISADVAGDPLWAPNAAGCAARGVAACWSVPVRAPDGEMLGTFAAFFNTPRPSTPAELAVVERAATLAGIAMDRERRERLLASINRNVNEGLYRSTPDRGLVYVNHALARMFGYDAPDDMLRRTTMLHYVEPGRRDELRAMISRAGHVENAEVHYRRADGTAFWGLLNATALYGPGGEVLYYDGAVSDITARRALEEQLRQAQKMEAVGKLAGGVAHDFNNLLTAITGYADETRTGLPASHALRGDAEEVLAAAERAASLTRQLLAFSRQQVLQPCVLDLRTVVSEAGGMLRRLIGEDIGFETTFGPGAAWVKVDRGQLEQVILNLVVNARDAMPGGGVLQIATGLRVLGEAEATAHVDLAPGPYVTLTVRDSGVGMSPEVRQRAFEPFFTTKGPGKGTGLGLATVYGIVRQSGGAVALESAEGRGTTVTILFPLVAAPGADEAAAVTPPARPRRARALIAEDEPMVRDLVRRTLARAGFEVSEAQDGVDALALARQLPGPIDLLVTDVVMPRMGGRELAQALQGERPGLRVLFMSGYATDAGTLPGTPTPDSAFLQKPFAPAGLLREVDALLAARA